MLPDAGRAAQLDFAAEQVGEFAADREAETRTAVFAARAGIGLLEGLEDDLLLLGRNSDAGVRDLESNDGRRAAKRRMIYVPSALCRP